MYSSKKIILTFDVETWNEGVWMKPFITKDLLNQNDFFRESIEVILSLLKNKDGHATFFVTDNVVKKYPDVVKKISDEGHEVGSHGVGHIKLTETNYSEYRELFLSHIKDIENITGKKVLGFRAPHFSLCEKSAWIVDLLEEAGLKYDSSAFPVPMGEYGSKKFPTKIYKIGRENIFQEKDKSPILEIPLSIYKTFIGNIPFAGGVYFRLLPICISKYILNRKIKSGNIPIIYFHPHELENRTPQIKSGPYVKRKIKYWGVNNSLKKFEKMTDCYIFDSIENTFLNQ
mgnify:CR=1 FL=1